MFGLFKKSKSNHIKSQFFLWQEACLLAADKEAMNTPRGKIATACFFIGGIDAICQSHNTEDITWLKLTEELIQKLGYPSGFTKPITKKYYIEQVRIELIQNSITEGGQSAVDFLSGRNKMAPLSFSLFIQKNSTPADLNSEETAYLV